MSYIDLDRQQALDLARFIMDETSRPRDRMPGGIRISPVRIPGAARYLVETRERGGQIGRARAMLRPKETTTTKGSR